MKSPPSQPSGDRCTTCCMCTLGLVKTTAVTEWRTWKGRKARSPRLVYNKPPIAPANWPQHNQNRSMRYLTQQQLPQPKGPRSSSSLSCTCITNHFSSLTDTAASASAILLQLPQHQQPNISNIPCPCIQVCNCQCRRQQAAPAFTSLRQAGRQPTFPMQGFLPQQLQPATSVCWITHTVKHPDVPAHNLQQRQVPNWSDQCCSCWPAVPAVLWWEGQAGVIGPTAAAACLPVPAPGYEEWHIRASTSGLFWNCSSQKQQPQDMQQQQQQEQSSKA